jgi:hypothetical protein
MSKVPVPHVASADELRITQDGDLAILAHADASVMTPQLEIDASKLATMRASDLVAYWNEHAKTQDGARAQLEAPPAPAQPPAATEPPPAVKIAKVVKVAPAAPRKRGRKPASKSDAPRTPLPAAPASGPAPKLAPSKPAPPKHAHVVALPIASTTRIDQLEQRFQALALEIGLSHAEALLRRVRAAARRLVE